MKRKGMYMNFIGEVFITDEDDNIFITNFDEIETFLRTMFDDTYAPLFENNLFYREMKRQSRVKQREKDKKQEEFFGCRIVDAQFKEIRR